MGAHIIWLCVMYQYVSWKWATLEREKEVRKLIGNTQIPFEWVAWYALEQLVHWPYIVSVTGL